MKLLLQQSQSPVVQRMRELCVLRGVEHRVVDLATDQGLIAAASFGADALFFRPDLHLVDLARCNRHLSIIEQLGVILFPGKNVALSHDNKLIQSLILTKLGVATPETKLVGCKEDAFAAANQLGYPLVAKLKSGAGSSGVRLLRTEAEFRDYCARMFGRGISPVPAPFSDVATVVRKCPSMSQLVRRVPAALVKRVRMVWTSPRECGYAFIQKYHPNNGDIRITVIGDRLFCFARKNRPQDFRASGSGLVSYPSPSEVAMYAEIAFDLTTRLESRVLAIDFILGAGGRPLVVEFCGGFVTSLVERCPWHVLRNGTYVEGHFEPETLILDDIQLACG